MIAQVHIELLVEGASRLGVELSKGALTGLSRYLEELLFWSSKIDLVSQTDSAEIIRKHLLDSLAVVPYLPPKVAILDLGSGAGFPGIPLAIVLSQSSIALLEARRKRVSFLKEAVRKLKARNLTVYEGRAEALATENVLREAFDVVITRATWDIPFLLHKAFPFLRDAGCVIAMRGPKSQGETLLSKEERAGFRFSQQHSYVLPFGHEQRSLLTFSKNVSRAT